MTRSAVALALAAACAASCGHSGASGTSTDGGGSNVGSGSGSNVGSGSGSGAFDAQTIEQFTEQYPLAWCAIYERCHALAPADIDLCTHDPAFQVEPEVQSAMFAGKTVFTAADATACLNTLASEPCAYAFNGLGYLPLPSSCRRIMAGTVAAGSACERAQDCQSGVCTLPDCPSGCCQGTCTAPPLGSAGDFCGQVDCQPGLYCPPGNQTCTVPLELGSACGSDVAGACVIGLTCSSGTCVPLPQVGDPCIGVLCFELGEYCGSDSLCHSTGFVGDPCTGGGACWYEFYQCNTTTDECEQLGGPGSACSNDIPCEPDEECPANAASPTCHLLGSAGDSCDGGYDNSSCGVNLQCANSVCVPYAAGSDCP